MKKIIAFLTALLLSVVIANAQVGIVAGITSSSAQINTEQVMENFNGVDQYHVGLAGKIGLPLGFRIQPELLYQIKGADLGGLIEDAGNGEDVSSKKDEFETKTGFAEVGLGLQWGLDLIAFRPFIYGKPFVGIAIADFDKFDENTKNLLEYGLSIGLGLDIIEHFQVSFEFYKNLGKLFNEGEIANLDSSTTQDLKDLNSYSGFKVSLGFFF